MAIKLLAWYCVHAMNDQWTLRRSYQISLAEMQSDGPFQRHVCDQKKWKISLLNGYSSWYKHAINKFLIDNSASCSSQDIQVFEN